MADILIRGMKMPRDCFECPFNRFGDVRDRVTSCWLKTEKREKCPLVPLPEGHGRLIDADALQEEFKKFHDGKRLMLIDTAPTIVPSEGN